MPNWIGSNTQFGTNPGDSAGFVFEKDYLNPKCPHAVSNWRVYRQGTDGQVLDDPTFKIQCVDECGGHFSGDSGVVESSADKTCKSLLAVPEGFAIEISFESFDVSFITISKYYYYNIIQLPSLFSDP